MKPKMAFAVVGLALACLMFPPLVTAKEVAATLEITGMM
jgi:hypothetical protein